MFKKAVGWQFLMTKAGGWQFSRTKSSRVAVFCNKEQEGDSLYAINEGGLQFFVTKKQ